MADTPAAETNGLYDVGQAAHYLQIMPNSVYQLRQQGVLEGQKRGRKLYFTQQELESLRTQSGSPPPSPTTQKSEQQREDADEEEILLSAKEAAQELGVQVSKIYNAMHAQQIEVINQAGQWRFSRKSLENYRQGIFPPPSLAGQQEKPTTTRYAAEREPESASEKMPLCYRCQRQFVSTREYTIKKFVDGTGELEWHPVCRDGRCDPTLVNARLAYQEQLALRKEQKKSAKLLEGLRALRAEIDRLLNQYGDE